MVEYQIAVSHDLRSAFGAYVLPVFGSIHDFPVVQKSCVRAEVDDVVANYPCTLR